MNRNTGALLKDIRNIKRNTTMFQSPQDIITSAKELKKIKSSQQININQFMQNKNQKIKNIDQKLEFHQSEIEKNNRIIRQLSQEFLAIKQQFNKEKERTQLQQRKNKLLKQEIERTNKLLRAKTIKVDELIKYKENLDRQVQGLRNIGEKNQQNIKSITGLRKQIIGMQQINNSLKSKMEQRDRDYLKLKQKLSETDTVKSLIDKLNAEISAKDSVISNYKISMHQTSIEKDKDISLRLNLEKQVQILNSELDEVRKSKQAAQRQYVSTQKKLTEVTKKLQLMEKENQSAQFKAKNHESEQNRARSQFQELKEKNQELIMQFNLKVTECNLQTSKLQKANQKVKELQLRIVDQKGEKQKYTLIENRFSELKLKGKSLETLYNSMLPQIQCPYGHQLKDPVTIIPCGHNYCLGCKKGYNKDCSQCKGKLKIQAVYRNQLMDDIIGIINSIKMVIDLIK